MFVSMVFFKLCLINFGDSYSHPVDPQNEVLSERWSPTMIGYENHYS
jgi:hypothetical protein